MKFRQMGKTGLRVSELCLGAMTFGRDNRRRQFQNSGSFRRSGRELH